MKPLITLGSAEWHLDSLTPRDSATTMSYALAPRDTRRPADRKFHSVSLPAPAPAWPDIAPSTITVTPACEGVYCYSVSESSSWTSADLFRILRAIVDSNPSRPVASGDGSDQLPTLG